MRNGTYTSPNKPSISFEASVRVNGKFRDVCANSDQYENIGLTKLQRASVLLMKRSFCLGLSLEGEIDNTGFW